jgi:hypothetical protein
MAQTRVKTPHSREAAAFFEVALTTDTSADSSRLRSSYRNSRGARPA